MKYVNTIRSWGASSLLTFLLYEVIWSVTSHAWPLHDGWLVLATDVLYCSVFVASSMAICGALSRIRVFRRIDFWSQTWLCLLTVTANLLLAFLFESVYNSVLETDDTALVQSSLYVFCAVATLFTLVHHTSRFYRIPLTMNDLEQQLNPDLFFRLNRQYIAHIDSIRKISFFFSSKLIVRLTGCDDDHIVISKEKSAQFKQWLDR